MNGALLREPEPHGPVRLWTVGGDDGIRTHDPLLAKHSGESVAVRGRQLKCRLEGVRSSWPYGPVRSVPPQIGSPSGSPDEGRFGWASERQSYEASRVSIDS